MKKIYLILRNVSLVLITGIFIVSCNKDETTTTPPSIIGMWTAGPASVTAMPGRQPLISYMAQYYMGKGLREDSAIIKAGNFEKGTLEEFKGTLQIKADSTCTSDLILFTLSGTWSLNPNRTVLTTQAAPNPFDPTRLFYLTSDVLDLTSSKLLLQIHQTFYLYNEKTGLDDVFPIEAVVNFTKE
jgi:hypothetical protein